MNAVSRGLTAAAALLLLGLYFLPLWKVELGAPQYPEGLGMYIDISEIRGFTEFDLARINALNHYIGMRAIDPASIPELKVMPWILGVLIGFGLLAAAVGRRVLLHTWLALLLAAAAVGLADFYRWGHDYGNNLDPTAIIKVPGMSYQPPVIGRKQLLNFTADSWPASGGLLGAFAFLLAAGAAYTARRDRYHGQGVAAVALAAAACTAAGPQPIAYDGTEACAYCRMVISDRRFGAQVITTAGRAHSFDSIECAASYYAAAVPDGRIRSAWVTDYSQPGELISVDSARFVRVTGASGSPMGMGLRAYAADSPDLAPGSYDWAGVLALVAEENAGHATHDHAEHGAFAGSFR